MFTKSEAFYDAIYGTMKDYEKEAQQIHAVIKQYKQSPGHALQTMRRHLNPGGVLLIEPWLAPERFKAGHLSATFVNQPDLKIARMNKGEVEGRLSIMNFHYLVATPAGIEHFT